MQTFLPYRDFAKSAECLDYRRLGKQRVEAMQIIAALNGRGGWQNHPATKMWKGHRDALGEYMNCMIDEWIKRGYRNNMRHYMMPYDVKYPAWLGDDKFHSSHRSNLLRKDPEFYGKFGWSEPHDLPYFWPVR